MDKKFICPAKLSRANWLGSDTYGDTFTIQADQVQMHVMLPPPPNLRSHVWAQDTITVTRTDAPGSAWGMNPVAKCCTA